MLLAGSCLAGSLQTALYNLISSISANSGGEHEGTCNLPPVTNLLPAKKVPFF